jgi:hypothetical protein
MAANSDDYEVLPDGLWTLGRLPGLVQVVCMAALRELQDRTSQANAKQHYQFCCGYVQALHNASWCSPHAYGYLQARVHKVGSDVRLSFQRAVCDVRAH